MNSKEWVEVQAPTVEEAIILGLTRLGITREDATVEIIDEGSQGFLGLGAKEARIRVKRKVQEPAVSVSQERAVTEEKMTPSPRKSGPPTKSKAADEPAPTPKQPKEEGQQPSKKQARKKKSARSPEPAPKAKAPAPREKVAADDPRKKIETVVLEIGSHLFGELEVQPKLTWREEERRPALWLSLEGEDAEDLVGHDGKTLNAAQFLMRVLVRSEIDGNFNLIVDAGDYRWRQYHSLEKLAQKMAKKALSSGQPVRLRPMPARDRRIVHMTLRDDDRVRTKSYGSGRGRAVTVFPVNSDNH